MWGFSSLRLESTKCRTQHLHRHKIQNYGWCRSQRRITKDTNVCKYSVSVDNFSVDIKHIDNAAERKTLIMRGYCVRQWQQRWPRGLTQQSQLKILFIASILLLNTESNYIVASRGATMMRLVGWWSTCTVYASGCLCALWKRQVAIALMRQKIARKHSQTLIHTKNVTQ